MGKDTAARIELGRSFHQMGTYIYIYIYIYIYMCVCVCIHKTLYLFILKQNISGSGA